MVVITIHVPAAAPTMIKYDPPPFAMLFVEPRGVPDVYIFTILSYAFGTTAVAYYLYRRWGLSSWEHVLLQVVAFHCFPMLPVIQSLRGGVGYFQLQHIEEIRIRVPIRVTMSKLHPKKILSEKWNGIAQVIEDVSNKNPAKFRLPRIPLALYVLVALPSWGVRQYVRRLACRFRTATLVAALFLDHRAGWISIGGLGASISTVLLQTSQKWRLSGMCSEQSQLPSLRIEILISAVLQDRLMWMVNQKTAISYIVDWSVRYNDLFIFGMGGVVVTVWKLRWSKEMVIMYLELAFLVAVAGLQVWNDGNEISEITNGIVHPWNYRWGENIGWW